MDYSPGMGDMSFICEHCEQSLVVDESGAGGVIACPQCEAIIQIPVNEVRPPAERDELTAVRREVDDLRRAFTETANEAARSKSLLTDAIQELRRTRQELAYAQAQLELASNAERNTRDELSSLTEAYTSTEEARMRMEAEVSALSHCRHEADTARQERDHLLLHSDAVQSELAAAQIDVAALRRERKELLFKLSGTEHALVETSQRATTAEEENIRLKTQLEALGTQFADTCQALFSSQAECAQLTADLKLNPEVARFVELREAGSKWREDLQQLEETVAAIRGELASAQAERELLRKQKTEAELKLAASRDALDDHRLQEENDVLKALVDRLNEEMKALSRTHRFRSSIDPSLGGMSDIKRWWVSRAFVPET